jgi:protein-disulfide isomerase
VARKARLTPFYWGLGALAVAGGAWIWNSTNRTGVEAYSAPVPASDTAGAGSFRGYVLGSDSAPVEVHEYADYTCPACGRFAILTYPDVLTRLIQPGRVRWRFHDRPLGNTGEHAYAYISAHAAACADEQGRFWEMQSQLFTNQGAWAWNPRRSPEGAFRDYARAIGLDLSRYNECMQTGRFRARIQAEAERAEALGISSTPTFVIGTLHIPGVLNYDDLKRLVDSAGTHSAAPR